MENNTCFKSTASCVAYDCICCYLTVTTVSHLGVIVDIDHIDRPVSVADEENGVFVWLQHLKEVNIGATVDKNKVLKLRQGINQNDK